MVNLYLSKLNSPLLSPLIIYSLLKRCQGGCETMTFGLIIFLIQFGFLLSGCRCTGRVPDKREWLSHRGKKKKGICMLHIWQHHSRKTWWVTDLALSWKKTWESGCIRAIYLRAFQRGDMAGSSSALAGSTWQTLDSVTFCYGSTWQFTALKSKWGAER